MKSLDEIFNPVCLDSKLSGKNHPEILLADISMNSLTSKEKVHYTRHFRIVAQKSSGNRGRAVPLCQRKKTSWNTETVADESHRDIVHDINKPKKKTIYRNISPDDSPPNVHK